MTPEIDPYRKRREDPRSTDELIRIALTEEDEDAAWDPVIVLHFRADAEVLEKARELCVSSNAKERKLGADILGQLGVPERAFPEDCFQILAQTLAHESDPIVLEAIAIAYGHLNDVRAVKLLVPLKKHPDADVRFAVVKGISCHDDELAIHTLIELSRDEDTDVRNWATFGLGSMIDTDTPEIREALLARITDSDDETRGEALVGLARRKDTRLLDPLIDELTSESVGLLALEAAEDLGDPRLGPALMLLKEEWANDEEDIHIRRLHHALLSCLPHGSTLTPPSSCPPQPHQIPRDGRTFPHLKSQENPNKTLNKTHQTKKSTTKHHNSPQKPKITFSHSQMAQPLLLTSRTRRSTLHSFRPHFS